MWSDLVADTAGLLLFMLWLALPPLYLIVLGRLYVRRCELTYRLLRDYGCECECRCPPEEDSGRHALRR